MEKRQHRRIAIRFPSHFSAKNQTIAGDGELRDLSPGGCRITSLTAVPVGIELDLCIFPEPEPNPFLVDGALVRWTQKQEFGLAFTQIRPEVQRRLDQLCRTLTL